MNRRGPFDCRVAMDPAAFARFCETRSITKCVPGPHTWPGRITVDACGGSVVLEADGYDSQDLPVTQPLSVRTGNHAAVLCAQPHRRQRQTVTPW